MLSKDVLLFEMSETLGAVIVDSSRQMIGLQVFPHVVPILNQLRMDGALLGLIANTGEESVTYLDRVLGRSGILDYFSPELRIYSSVAGLTKDTPEIFGFAFAQAQRMAGSASVKMVFVGESRTARTMAKVVGMRTAPHPALARSVLAGGKQVYLLLRVCRNEAAGLGALFAAAGAVALHRAEVGATVEIIALATDISIPLLQAGGAAVTVLPDAADDGRDDLYLIRSQTASQTSTLSAFAANRPRSLIKTADGLVVSLAPHQTIDDFHVGNSHGHSLKLLADPTLLSRSPGAAVSPAPAFVAGAGLSPEELATLAATITEQKFEEVLRFVTGMDGRPGAVGINRHALNPQMGAVTEGLMKEFVRIGQGAFTVSGHRFEITGRDRKDVFGVPVANRIELFNVIAELPGESDEAVVITAHLDLTAADAFHNSYDPSVHDAPGVDDGSGVAAVLLIAEFMRRTFASRKPARTLRFVLFNAEEQGLIGSERYARARAACGDRIAAVLHMDMIAYNNSQPNIFEIHAGTSSVSANPEEPQVEAASLAVADLLRRAAEIVAGEGLSILAPGEVFGSPDPAACRSDHFSFQRRGYAAVAISEDFFPSPQNLADANPNYHLISDRVVDLPFATSLARVICAAALRAAQPPAPTSLLAATSFGVAPAKVERVTGRVVVTYNYAPTEGLVVSVRAGGSLASIEMARGAVAEDGSFALEIAPGSYHLVVQDADGASLASTHETPLTIDVGRPVTLHLTMERSSTLKKAEPGNRRSALFAQMTLKADGASEVTPEDILDLARAQVASEKPAFADRFFAEDDTARPNQSDDPKQTLCGTEQLRKLDGLAELQVFVDPAIVKLKVRNILAMGESGFASKTHTTLNFSISYQIDGPAAVENDLSDLDVIEPGSNPARVIATLPGGTVPAYVRLVAFWLERSLQFYTSAPFSMRNPAANGRLLAFINSAPFGSALPDGFYINNRLPAELVCEVAVHELFHMVQYAYDGPGPWRSGIFEGGATFAEDTVCDLMNRYLDEAGSNFNGVGLLANPNQSLFSSSARYKSSLFWRYIAEQRSRLTDVSTIGVDAYRTVIEECAAKGYTTESVKRAIRGLPFDSELCAFSYDFDLPDMPVSTETTFGNFALACYLKDLDERPDARFGFQENKENIHVDDVVRLVIPSAPTTDTLVKVKREHTILTADGPKAVFQGSVNALANCFYEFGVAPDLRTVDLEFSAGASFSGLLQLVAIDENGRVRDIVRSDKRTYRRLLTNHSGGQRISTLTVIVSGGDVGGSFQVSARPAEDVADVMITQWNSASGNEYHINPHDFAWTWVSPDLWFEPAADGCLAVKVRLRNKGSKPAENVGCQVTFRPGSALPGIPWLPILDGNGAVQRIDGERIEAGEVKEFSLPWKPTQVSEDGIFILRAQAMSPDDANPDNNLAFSRLAMTRAEPGDSDIIALAAVMPQLATNGNIEAVWRPRRADRSMLGLGPLSNMGGSLMQTSTATRIRTGARLNRPDKSARLAIPPVCAACSAVTLRHYRPDGSLAPGATLFFAEGPDGQSGVRPAESAPVKRAAKLRATRVDLR